MLLTKYASLSLTVHVQRESKAIVLNRLRITTNDVTLTCSL